MSVRPAAAFPFTAAGCRVCDRLIKTRIETLLDLLEGKPGIVFWIGDRSVSEEEIYRHLHGINRILMPLERDMAIRPVLFEGSKASGTALAASGLEQDAPSPQ